LNQEAGNLAARVTIDVKISFRVTADRYAERPFLQRRRFFSGFLSLDILHTLVLLTEAMDGRTNQAALTPLHL
jgi:hypothetical protein